MFSFFHRTAALHVDAFTSNRAAYEVTPIVNSYKAMPKWMNEVPKTTQKYGYNHLGNIVNASRRSIRTCPGFIDLYRKGFILETWADFVVDVRSDKFSYHFTNGPEPAIFPPDVDILPGFERHFIMKLGSPWMIKTEERIPFIALGTEWSLEHIDAKIIPGSITFKEHNATNVFLVFKRPEPGNEYQLKIPIGEPLQQFVPLTERKVKVHTHLVSPEEMQRMIIPGKTSVHGWRKIASLVRRNENRSKMKCPFTSSE